MTRTVRIANAHLLIDDVPSIVLCASLFPFRIPPEQWLKRLAAVKRLGYHAIDVYIPWNYHELSPGEFKFDEDRDIDRFLTLAVETDLLVFARPGPYICSEYDGGGLPAWLGATEGLRLRQNEPLYLAQVKLWFDRVLPILEKHQVTNGGAVALVQIENELDFFACDDPAGYIAALKTMVDEWKIRVPILACAGQGDLERASGLIDDVIPAVNLYPDDESPAIEQTTSYYAQHVNAQGFPLLVTETNRLHRTLKRELAAGAVLLGPYLQASGWNFDYAASAGNWGNPLGFMAADYDFGGAIAPDGSERKDASEGRILSLIIKSLGPSLGASTHGTVPDLIFGSSQVEALFSTSARALAGGGTLTGITNLNETVAAAVLVVSGEKFPVRVESGQCLLLPSDLPLNSLGIAGTLVATNSEVIQFDSVGNAAHITVHTEHVASLRLSLLNTWHVGTLTGDATIDETSPGQFALGAADGTAIFTFGEKTLTVSAIATVVAAQPAGGLNALLPNADADSVPEAGPIVVEDVRLARRRTDFRAVATLVPGSNEQPRHMENLGIYRGGAIYLSNLNGGNAHGLLLGAAGDIVTVTVDQDQLPTVINGGNDLFVDFGGEVVLQAGIPVTIRAEIWGHSNFHDNRLPSLRLGSLRGLSSASLVTDLVDLDAGWTISSPTTKTSIGADPAPRSNWGSWSNSSRPEVVSYRRTLKLPAESNTAAIRISGTESVHDIVIEGKLVGQITPLSPVLEISAALAPGEPFTLDISTARNFSEKFGSVELLIGSSVTEWEIAGFGVPELVADAQRAIEPALSAQLPIKLEPGEARWLSMSMSDILGKDFLRDALIRTSGENVRLTFVNHGHIIGRVWTEEPSGAPITGGRGDIALAPAPWLNDDPIVNVLVETVGCAPGIIKAFMVSHQIDGDA